jgi:hypothetical protein
MDSDRDFGHIEKKVREVGNIYSTDLCQVIMAQSQVKAKPHITRIQGNLYDIQSLPASLGLMHRKITTDGESVRFRDGLRWIRVEEFGSYKFKESLGEEAEWKTGVDENRFRCDRTRAEHFRLLHKRFRTY